MADLARVESAVAERKLAVIAKLADRRLSQQRTRNVTGELTQRKADALGALVDGTSHLPCACGRAGCAQQPPADCPVARWPGGRVAR